MKLNAPKPFRLRSAMHAKIKTPSAGSLSSSFAEPLSIKELCGIDPGLQGKLLNATADYPAVHGSARLKECIGAFLKMPPECIVVTNGVDDSINGLSEILLDTGEALSCLTPGYKPLTYWAQARGADIRTIALEDAQTRWRLDQTDIYNTVDEACRVFLINAPHNPTGWTPTQEEFETILARIEAVKGWVIADEVYAGLEHDGEPAWGAGAMARASERIVTVGSLTKSFGLPGLRVGWVASKNPELINAVKAYRSYGHCYISVLSELAACSALEHSQTILERNCAVTSANLDLLDACVARQAALSYHRPKSGPVCQVNFDAAKSGFSSASDVANALLSASGVQLATNEDFEALGSWFRFGAARQDFPKNLEIFEDMLKDAAAS